jgi:NADP-dependent 3-hydroxy acid dehydrogenase YdfG
MASSKPLEGKIAIVTGASRGIGRAIALRLAQDGASLVLAARTESDLARVAGEIKSNGGQATTFAADLRDSPAPAALVKAALDAFRAIDIVVNNAGAT